jgi:adenylate kinase
MSVNLIMLGPPGAGKGTQAERFAREEGLPKISTGDILRDAVTAGSELGCIAKRAMDAGQLVSDDVMIGVARERLSRPDVAHGFILDGFPRTVAQAEALDQMMVGRAPLVVIEIVVPTDELVRRTSRRRVCSRCGFTTIADGSATCSRCGGELVSRSDDNEAVVRERLQVYQRQTQPLVDYYKARPTFRVVNGNQPQEAVAQDLRAAIQAARASGGSGGMRTPQGGRQAEQL